MKGIGENFSEGGASLKVGKALPVKTLVYLEMSFPFSQTPVLATAEVIRRQTAEHRGKKVSRIMVRYLLTFFRFEFEIPARYRFAKNVEPGRYRVSPYLKGIGENFSEGGASLKVGKALPVKTLVYLEMSFPFSQTPVLATAEVIRRQTAEHRGKKVSRIMVRYLLIDDTARDRMTAFIISRGKTS